MQAARKEGLQPLTRENLAEFHEEEESWEDPKDYGIWLRLMCDVRYPTTHSQSTRSMLQAPCLWLQL